MAATSRDQIETQLSLLLHSSMHHSNLRTIKNDLTNLLQNISIPENPSVSISESPNVFMPESLSDNNNQSVNDKPMEYAYDINNIYFSVKTTESNYKERLGLLMMTWFQVVNNKVSSCV